MNPTKKSSNMITSNYKFRFTVFTPTYNRGYCLERVFKSLMSQTFRDFEWLIVDDGSNDNTRDKVFDFEKQAWFPLRYVYQENRGKPMAINLGVKLAQGGLFLIADSDDEFFHNALDVLYKIWEGIQDKEHFCAVTGLCIDSQTHKIVGDKFPSDIFDSTPLEKNYIYKIKGEKWGFIRTDILRDYPFPEIEGEKFISESYIWKKIGRKYKTRYINKPLRIYYRQGIDSISSNKKFSNPKSNLKRDLSILNEDFYYLFYAKKAMIAKLINIHRFRIHCGVSFFAVYGKINAWYKKALFVMAFPFGVIFAIGDHVRRRI